MKTLNEEINKIKHLFNYKKGNVVNEGSGDGDDVPLEQLPKEIQDFAKRYNLSGTFSHHGEIGRFGYNKGNVHSSINASDIQTYEANKEKLSQCQERGKFFSQTYKNLMTGTNTQQDPEMQKYCERYPEHPKCKNQGGGRMHDHQANIKATELMNQKFPNMEFCGVVQKVDSIIKM